MFIVFILLDRPSAFSLPGQFPPAEESRQLDEDTTASSMHKPIQSMHDVNLATRFSDHLLLLYGEGETRQGPVELIANEENLSRLYQHQLHRYQVGDTYVFYPA